MNLHELEALQASKGWNLFGFESENQPDYPDDSAYFSMRFDTMKIFPFDTPKVLFAAGKQDMFYKYPFSMTLSGVVSVELIDQLVFWDVLEITCKDGRKYIIVACKE